MAEGRGHGGAPGSAGRGAGASGARAAVAAGKRALASLRRADECLDSARKWGLWDIVGGGIVSSLVKRSRMDDASDAVRQAQSDLEAFARELGDARGVCGVDLQRSDLLELFDIVFDNPINDLFVQSRIEDASAGVKRAIRRVSALLAELGQGR